MELTLRIPGVPVPQPRVKATNRGKHAGVYTPTSTKDSQGNRKSNGVAEFKALVRLVASEHYTDPPLAAVPIVVDVTFVFPRQATRPKWMDKDVWKTGVAYPHTIKPDRDNLDKMILDALSGVVFANDCVVWAGHLSKWHAAVDGQPHTMITITTRDERRSDDGQACCL